MEKSASLYQLMAGGLPTEIVLFKAGENRTKKGSFLLDSEALTSILDRFADHGADRLPFDAGHEMINPKGPDSHKALGWFIPKSDEAGNLLATDIQWTEAGASALSNREFRFFSPAITYDSETMRITGLTNVALTNLPATAGQEPLVLDATEEQTLTKPKEKNMQVLLDTLGASDENGAVKKLSELSVALGVSLTEAPKAIADLKAQAQAGIEAQAELAQISKDRAAEKRAHEIESLLSDGRLLEGQREFAALLSDDQFEVFKATLKASPVLTKKIEEPTEKTAALSDVEKATAKQLGLSEAEFIAAKEGK